MLYKEMRRRRDQTSILSIDGRLQNDMMSFFLSYFTNHVTGENGTPDVDAPRPAGLV